MNPDPWSGFLMSFNTCRPTSRGSVHIRSADPHVKPVIVPNSLSTPADVQDVFDGARVVRELSLLERPAVERDGSGLIAARRCETPVQPPQGRQAPA